MSQYVQYGCGLSAPEGWLNFDASPTLQIQKIPLVGKMLVSNRVVFPDAVKYGDIITGLPGIMENSCNGIYCSHILEHLSLDDFRTALQKTYSYLKKGGVFRCVVPDLEFYIQQYVTMLQSNKTKAALEFIKGTLLGVETRKKGLKGLLVNHFSNAHHLWMWDQYSLADELKNAGFSTVRICSFNDSSDEHFILVEDEGRFYNAVGLEAIK